MIDEKKLIEAIKKYHDGLKPKYISKLVDAEILDIIDIINEQPKVGEWIPVEEALPEPYVDVIVTYIYNEKKYVRTAFNCNGKNWWWTDIQKDFDVIAWQPLPKPYKSEG